MNRQKKNKKLALIGVIFLLIVAIIIGIIIYNSFFKKNNKKTVVVKEISEYGYKLEKRDTKLMVDTFNELDTILSKNDIDYQKYAECLSKLFVIDLYTIANKIDTYDVGGVEYIYPDDVDEYKYNVMGTLYNYIGYIDNRDVKLPEVKKITSIQSSETTFDYNNETYDAYDVKIKWDYVKDLGYDEQAEITVFKVDNKLYIGEFITSEAQDE